MSAVLDSSSNYKKVETLDENRLFARGDVMLGPEIFLYGFIKQIHLLDLYDRLDLSESEKDTLLALLFYYLSRVQRDEDAIYYDYYSIISYLFPEADLRASNIDQLLIKVGERAFQKDFFQKWITYLKSQGLAEKNILTSSWMESILDDHRLGAEFAHGQARFPDFQLLFGFDRENKIPLFYQMPEHLFQRKLFRDGLGNADVWCNRKEIKQALNLAEEYDLNISLCDLEFAYKDLNVLNVFYEKSCLLKQGFIAGVHLENSICEEIFAHEFHRLEEGENVLDYQNEPFSYLAFPIYLDEKKKHKAWFCFYVNLNYRKEIIEQLEERRKNGWMTQETFETYKKRAGCFILISQRQRTPRGLLDKGERFKKEVHTFRYFMDHHLALRPQAEVTFDGYLFLLFAAYGIERLLDLFLKSSKLDGLTALQRLIDLRGELDDDEVVIHSLYMESLVPLMLLFDIRLPIRFELKDDKLDLSSRLRDIQHIKKKQGKKGKKQKEEK